MKYWLLSLVLLSGPLAMGKAASPLPPLPESSLQAATSTTTVTSVAGGRYQYQLVHLDNQQIWLAPAWHGQTKLAPARRFLNYEAQGELDGLLMTTLNQLAADGWDILEIRNTTRPVEAVQKVERELQFNNPNQPRYTGTTSIRTSSDRTSSDRTSSETRYLFRRALP
jgi:hypothetical protein